jgi:hypothetical protein
MGGKRGSEIKNKRRISFPMDRRLAAGLEPNSGGLMKFCHVDNAISC